MEQARARLPVRLLPRERSLIFRLCVFAFLFVFSVFWTPLAMAPGMHVDPTDSAGQWLFLLVGVLFFLVGAIGLGLTVLKMLPGNPYFHVDFFVDALVVRHVFKEQKFTWRELPALTLKEGSDSEGGPYYAVVAIDTTSAKPREMLSIPVDQYGSANNKESAYQLIVWVNHLRNLALENRLDGGTEIEIPDGLACHVVTLSMPTLLGATAGRTVVRTR